MRIVTPNELRQRFAAAAVLERVQKGELRAKVRKERHPSPPAAPVPFCTRSQVLQYLDASGALVAVTHRYLRPDGTLGASGLEDPKLLVLDGETLRCL